MEHAMRVGRTAFGVVLTGTGASVLVNGIASHDSHAMAWLGWGWGAAIAAFVVGTMVGRVLPGQRRLGPSLVWPSIGLALTLPLSMHALLAAWAGFRSFDDWVYLVARYGMPAHLVAAIVFGWRSHQLATGRAAWSVGGCYFGVCAAGVFPLVFSAMVVAITGLPFLLIVMYLEWLAKQEFEHVQISAARALPKERAVVSF